MITIFIFTTPSNSLIFWFQYCRATTSISDISAEPTAMAWHGLLAPNSHKLVYGMMTATSTVLRIYCTIVSAGVKCLKN